MALGLRPFSQRTGDGAGVPVLDSDNGEELMHIQSAVSIVLGNRPPESPGTLYISTHQVIWLSDVDRSKGYAVDFLSVSLHAVSRDPEAYPSPCIYTQIESQEDGEESEGSDSECSDPLDLSKITEMRLVPSDPNQLETLFQIFCECAELNPEPSDEEDGDEVGHNWVFNVGRIEEAEDSDWNVSHNPTSTIGYSNGDHDLVQNVHQLNIDDQRFEDAEEMEHEGNGGHQ